MTRMRPAIPVIFLVLLTAGCSSSTSPQTGIDVQQLASKTSDFQRKILADGVVTPAEYEQALLADRQCVSEAGAKVGDLYKIGNNELTFDFEVIADTQSAVDAVNAKADKCLPQFRSDVGAVWAQQQLLSPKQREDLRPKVVACLNDAGIKVKADAGFDEIVKDIYNSGAIERSTPCFKKYPGFFAVPAKSK